MRMQETDHYYHTKLLVDAIREGQCVFFLGAGIAGISSKELMKHLIGRLKEYRLLGRNIWGLSGIAQYFEIMLGRDRLRNEIRDYVERNAVPSEIHKLVARLPVKTIFTTNYDRILEDQFDEINREYSPVVTGEDLQKWDKKRAAIVKLHGSFERYPPRLVITDDDYISFIMEPNLLKDHFKRVLSKSTTVFIGYSLSDYNIKLLLKEVNLTLVGGGPLGYLIQKEQIYEEQIGYWRDRGIVTFQADGIILLRNLEETL